MEFKDPIQNLEGVENKFKNSKVRGEDGKLLEVYHFSDDDVGEFSLDHVGKNYKGDKGFFGEGIYFTDDKESFGYGSKKYSAYLNLQNPLIIENPSIEDVKKLNGKFQELIDEGYDGVMVWNDKKKDERKTIFGKKVVINGKEAGWSELVVFDPDNIHIIDK